MKQLLFLLLFPCFAIAQYQGNANQKITLGEQTTADGLVWRGIRADTTSKIVPFSDTSAYIILDTVEKTLWLYKAGQVPKWQQVGGSTLDTATMLLPYYRAGRNTIIQAGDVPTLNQNTTGSAATLTTGRTIQTNLASTSAATFNGSANITPGVTGVLPVANGGTNLTTLTAANRIPYSTSATALTTSSGLTYDGASIKVEFSQTGNSNLLIVSNPSTSGQFAAAPLALRCHNGTALEDVLTLNATSSTWNYQDYGANSAILTASQTGGMRFFSVNALGQFRFYTKGDGSSDLKFLIEKDGEVGIGTSDATEKLHVVGNARITAMNGINDIGASATGVLQAATSDMNLKNTIENSPFGLNEILLLNPVTFLYNDENRKIDSDVKEVGFIAQDVFDVIPNAVSSTGIGDLQLDYRAITATLVKAIQEQQALIKTLEQRILILENK